jgi:hypothetical protein
MPYDFLKMVMSFFFVLILFPWLVYGMKYTKIFFPSSFTLTHATTPYLNLFKFLQVPTHVCFDPPMANTYTLTLHGASRAHPKKISMSIHTQVIQQAYLPNKSHRKIFHMPCIFFQIKLKYLGGFKNAYVTLN